MGIRLSKETKKLMNQLVKQISKEIGKDWILSIDSDASNKEMALTSKTSSVERSLPLR